MGDVTYNEKPIAILRDNEKELSKEMTSITSSLIDTMILDKNKDAINNTTSNAETNNFNNSEIEKQITIDGKSRESKSENTSDNVVISCIDKHLRKNYQQLDQNSSLA